MSCKWKVLLDSAQVGTKMGPGKAKFDVRESSVYWMEALYGKNIYAGVKSTRL